MKHPPFKPCSALLAALLLTLTPAAVVLAAETATTLAAPASTSSTALAVHSFTLANGLTLIVKPDRRAPTAVQMLWLRVGSMDEVDGTSGVAHVLEHMMFKGTRNLKAGEFSRRVAALGGRENAFTSKDFTAYFQQIPAARLPDVMQLEADRFANNQWSDEEFAKELEVVKEERRLRTDDVPRALLSEAQQAVVFVASPYRRPIVGWMSDLDAMTPTDARAFFQRWYSPANAAVVVAGDVDVAQVRALAEKFYGPIPARTLPARKPREEPAQVGLRRLDFKAPAEQALVALAFKVPRLQSLDPAAASAASDTDALALTVLSALLDGYSGARLERALTQGEQAVADSANSSNGLSGRGPQLFWLEGVPAAGVQPEVVEAALRQQITKIAQEGVSEAELKRVKTQWVASAVYRQDSVFFQARELGEHWVEGLPLDTSQRLIERLRGISAAQVQAVAARYFGDDQLTVATLRPQPIATAARPPRLAPTGLRH